MTRPDGYFYKGDWFKGKRQGQGQCKTAEGKWFIGLFCEDEIVGPNMINKKEQEKLVQEKLSQNKRKYHGQKYDIYKPKDIGLTFKPLYKVRDENN